MHLSRRQGGYFKQNTVKSSVKCWRKPTTEADIQEKIRRKLLRRDERIVQENTERKNSDVRFLMLELT